jgi:hypothetical protein
VRGLRRAVDRDFDSDPNALRILHDVIRPKAENTPAVALHCCRAARISPDLKCMLFAVDFDNELLRYAGEVGEVGTNGCW